MKPKTVMWIAIAAVAAIIAFLAFRPSGGAGTRNVDAPGAQQAIDSGAQIVDVRTAGEFQMGHIPGAINVPVDQLGTQAQGWDRDKTYLIYCATGSRSQAAVSTMESLGFNSIVHFAPGIQAWTGQLETGESSAAATTVETAGKPVMIEFYTDS